MQSSRSETIEFREIRSTLRRRRRLVWGGMLVGALAALTLSLVLPPSYHGRATILLRDDGADGFSMMEGMIPFGGFLGDLGGNAFDTELEILTSRSVVGQVVDSLQLQARVVEPRGMPAEDLFQRVATGPVGTRRAYTFEREGDRYRVQGPGIRAHAVPGQPVRIAGGEVVLSTGALPDRFRVRFRSRAVAIDDVLDDLRARSASGDVAELRYYARDPRTAAAVPNAVMDRYLERRRTTDRGVNHHRYEFLVLQVDSIDRALAEAEQRLRQYQEGSGMLDPEITAQSGAEEAMRLQASLTDLEVEAGALERILTGDRLMPRELAAYPSMLRNAAINRILDRLLELEVQRSTLLERRTENDRDVMLINQQIRQLEGELESLSRAYLRGLRDQRQQLQGEVRRYGVALADMPLHAQQIYGTQREVKRLSETQLALHAHLVQTRLAAMGEGGDIRPIDHAEPPEKPYFPRPALLTLGGLLAGLFFGVGLAITGALLGPRVRSTWEAKRITGAPAVMLDGALPLRLAGVRAPAVALVLPVGGAPPGPTAARLAATAALGGTRVALVDLHEGNGGAPEPVHAGAAELPVAVTSGNGATAVAAREAGVDGYVAYRADPAEVPPIGIREGVEALRQEFELVVAALPPLDSPVSTALLTGDRPVVLVAEAGRVSREALGDAAEAVREMGMELAGVVLHAPASRRN